MTTTAPAKTYIAFDVEGAPAPQGSMRSPRAGVVLHDSARLKAWRELVGWRAREAYKGQPHQGPVSISLTFALRPPRRDAPLSAMRKPDLDKLVRACLDALSGVVYVDDAQIVSIEAHKAWAIGGLTPGVTVELWLGAGK